MNGRPRSNIHGGALAARATLLALLVLALPATAHASGPGSDPVDQVLAAGSQAAHTAGPVKVEAAARAIASVAHVSTVRLAADPVVPRGADPVPMAVRAASPVAASGQPSLRPVEADGLAAQVTRAVSPPATGGAGAPARRVLVAARRLAGAVVSAARVPVPGERSSASWGRQLGSWLVAIERSGGWALARGPLIRRSLWPPPLAVSPGVPAASSANGGHRGIPAWWARVRVATAVGGKVAMTGSGTSGARAARAASGLSRLPAHPPVARASPGAGPLLLATSPAGAAGAVGSGGIGAGGAAGGALLVLAALWLLYALLPGRLALELSPWQSALLSLRLERPG